MIKTVRININNTPSEIPTIIPMYLWTATAGVVRVSFVDVVCVSVMGVVVCVSVMGVVVCGVVIGGVHVPVVAEVMGEVQLVV